MKMRAQNKETFKRVLPWSGVVVFFLLTYVMITYDASHRRILPFPSLVVNQHELQQHPL